jgi:hypothetical protein
MLRASVLTREGTCNCIQMIIDVHETRCLQFRPFVNTHLNTLILFFGYWFRQIAIRLRDWRVSFLHCPAIVQITVSPVSPVRFRAFRYAVRNEALSQSRGVGYVLKLVISH